MLKPRFAKWNSRGGFTLVELLVVIGIIGILVALLLPGLNSARRQSISIKCLSNLRTIGQALYQYGVDNKGAWPVVQDYTTVALPTKYAGQVRDGRWNIMLLPYITSPGDAANFTITYGAPGSSGIAVSAGPGLGAYNYSAMFCPASEEFKLNVPEAIYAVQCGYGMQKQPLNSATFPGPGTTDGNYVAAGSPPGSQWARVRPSATGNGSWFRQTDWNKEGADRIVIADARSYDLDVAPWPSAGIRDETPGYQGDQTNNDNQAHRFRHGVVSGQYDDSGVTRLKGRVAFNALYCDGHARTLTTIEELWDGVRRRRTP